MEITTAFFYLFATILMFASFQVVTAKNAVHAALYLVLAFTQASALWMMLEAEFLSIVLIVVYIGAVMVLFLFVVMMLDIRIDKVKSAFWKNFPLAMGLGALVAVEMIAVLFNGFATEPNLVSAQSQATAPAVIQFSNTKELGKLMYSEFVYPIQVAAAILLVAMVAAIALTLRGRKDTRTTDAAQQVRVKAKDRMVVVKMNSEPPVVSAKPEAPPSDAAPAATVAAPTAEVKKS